MYEFNLTLSMPFDQALDKVRDALMSENLGIVSDVDVQAIFKDKIDKEIRPYRILGTCNPKLADRVIDSEPNAGVLLPCNQVVRETGDGKTSVVFMDPMAVFGLTDADEPNAVAAEARVMLERVADALS